MEDKELQEFDLEDIIKEFGDHPEEIEETVEQIEEEALPEEIDAEDAAKESSEEDDKISRMIARFRHEIPIEETTIVFKRISQEEETQPVAAMADETVRMDEIREEIAEQSANTVTDATIRFEGIPETKTSVGDETIRFDKLPDTQVEVAGAQRILDEEEDPIYIPPEQAPKAEPYSDEWEPEYEQPMGEYVPPRIIPLRPKSRIRELKQKLVAGPEKLYYKLSENGLGKVQAAIFFTLLIVLASAAATAVYAVGWVPVARTKLMVFGQLLAMLLSALLGCYQLLEGIVDIARKRFSLNSLLVFTFVFCCVDGVLCLQQQRVPCCAAFSLQVMMSLWNSYHKRNTKLGQLDTMRKATRLDSLTAVEEYHDGMKGVLRGEGQVEDFMDTLDQPAQQEKTLNVYALVGLLISVALGVAAGVLQGLNQGIYAGISAGFQVAAVTTIAAMPASMLIAVSRPMAVLERRMHALGTVFCGWQGVDALSGKVLFPVGHEDLLPVGSVKMNGVKFFGSRQPDQIIAYTTALINANGGSLEPVFNQLLESRNGMHYTAQDVAYYDNDGIGGQVNGEAVLVGTLTFLKEMGVEVPEGIRVNHAVCVAVDGELCGLYAVTVEKNRAASAGMVTLCGYRGLKPILTSNDFMLTEKFIRNHFEVKTKRIVFPAPATRIELQDKTVEQESRAAALITGEGLAAFAYAATGARTLKGAATTGMVVHMIGGILGMLMMLVLVVLGRVDLLTPASMFLYELIWMIPGLLITEWTRSI